jgi:hypothetical protein
MAYGIVHHFPGGTKEQYEASIAAVHPSDGSLPEGQLFHAAGPAGDGWKIVAVHDSQQGWERCSVESLLAAMHAGIDGGFSTPPEEKAFPVHNQQTR